MLWAGGVVLALGVTLSSAGRQEDWRRGRGGNRWTAGTWVHPVTLKYFPHYRPTLIIAVYFRTKPLLK